MLTAEQHAWPRRLTLEEYEQLDGERWSHLKNLAVSPRHYEAARHRARPDTDALRLGRAGHTAVFEPDRLPLDYVVFDGDKVKSPKDWKAFKDVHRGRRSILDVDEYDRALHIRDAVRTHPLVAPLLAKGTPEVAIAWQDKKSGVACKARLDWLPEEPAVVDLKTSRMATDERAFAAAAFRLGYFGQVAHYANGLCSVLGRAPLSLPCYLIAVENAEPYDAAVYRVSDDALYAASELRDELLAKLAECRAAQVWPGRHHAVLELDFPRWALPNAEDLDVGDEPEWMKGA